MKRQPRTALSLERLEDRWVPASTSFSAGILTITNTSLAAQTVTITQTASNTFTLSGNASGTFSGVTLINYKGSNGVDSVTLDLGGLVYGGGLIANTQAGNDDVVVTNGTMQGSLTALTGLGNDTVSLALGGAAGLTVQSNVNITDLYGTNRLELAQNGDVVVNSDLSVTGFATVAQTGSNGINVDGSFTINNSITGTDNTITLNGSAGTDAVIVRKNFTVTTGTGNDSITLGANATANALEVDGRLSVTTGAGNDTVTINGGGGGFVLLSMDTGAGNDSVSLVNSSDATWSVSIQLGDGNDTIALNNGTGTAAFVTGTINGGAGVNIKTQGTQWTQTSPYSESGF